jgi:molybdopterin biosynthesis enzyme
VRASTVPVAFPSPGHVTPLDYHGSAHIAAMSRAEGLLTLPAGVAVMEKGAEVHVRPL